MRLYDYSSAGKTIAASTTIQFTSSDVPSNGIVAYHFGMTGAGNTLANISRIRAKANGTTFYDLTPNQLRAWIQRFSQACISYPANLSLDPIIGAGTASDFRRFTLPFFDPSQPTEDAADVYQFPRNSQVTIEIQFGAGAAAGTVFCGWTETSQTAMAYPKLLSSQMNIGASLATGKYPFTEDGIVKGVGLNTLGNGRTKVVVDGIQVFHMQGQAANSATVTADSMILESQQMANGMPAEAAATAGVPNTVFDPTFLKLPQPRTAPPGRSFIELTTTAAWGGVTNEACIYSQVVYEEFRKQKARAALAASG